MEVVHERGVARVGRHAGAELSVAEQPTSKQIGQSWCWKFRFVERKARTDGTLAS
jgi:hypothetical protein